MEERKQYGWEEFLKDEEAVQEYEAFLAEISKESIMGGMKEIFGECQWLLERIHGKKMPLNKENSDAFKGMEKRLMARAIELSEKTGKSARKCIGWAAEELKKEDGATDEGECRDCGAVLKQTEDCVYCENCDDPFQADAANDRLNDK